MSDYMPEPDMATVDYEIAGSSEPSGTYVAENILVDRPRDQNSRWSGSTATSNTKQWIRLRLKNPCVLKSITFGKFYKTHPCNMKDCKVLIGMSESNMIEILHATLKNDPNPETFSIKSINRIGIPFPTRFVEIVPLSGHGQSFNTSIWHISLSGITDSTYIERIRLRHQEYRENVALRQIVKHLRQRRFLTPVTQILSRSGLQLEHPLVTSLHEAFVLQGDWSTAEKLIQDCADEGLLTAHRHACQTHMHWSRIRGLDRDGDLPCSRSGHAMCIDEQNGMIYLFGGWNGQRSLEDFWEYDIAKDSWRRISRETSTEKNGPGPRSCHKMVFDSKTGSIYLLGKLGDGDEPAIPRSRVPDLRDGPAAGSRDGTHPWAASPVILGTSPPTEPIVAAPPLGSAWPSHCSEFYRYHTRGLDAGKWDLLTFDTSSSGGPPLISDHQMAIDSEAQVIYISGGRVVDAEWDALKVSGVYSYDIRTSIWKLYNISDAYASHPYIPPRFGHSMVLDHKFQTLFIFAGQRDEKFLSDMYAFHIPTNTVTELFSNFTAAGGPDPSFTQRAVIDVEKQEIYVLCGLTRAKPNMTPVVESESPYWVYRYDRPELPGKWSTILPSTDEDAVYPPPRYAHQVVYDPKSSHVYMHGGAASLGLDEEQDVDPRLSGSGDDSAAARTLSDPDKRLDDFWQLDVVRPGNEEIVRRALYEIRQQQFRELCEDGSPIKALTFLQTRVASVVNHDDPEEAKVFRSLLSAHLLSAPARPAPAPAATPTSTATSSGSGPKVGNADGENGGRVDSPPPRKRSRPSSPSGLSVLQYDADPEEAGGNPPSPERYRQRTQMFEKLLAFVNEDAKQPDENLLEMMSADRAVI